MALATAASFLIASLAVLTTAPLAAAAPPPAATIVTLACSADAGGLPGVGQTLSQQQAVPVAISAPATVLPGGTYTVTITPGAITFPPEVTNGDITASFSTVSEITLRIALPSGATPVKAVLNRDGSSGIGTVTETTGSANGVSYLEEDVTGPINTGATVTFPSMTVTFTAPDTVGADLTMGLTGSASTAAAAGDAAPTITAPAGLAFTESATVPGGDKVDVATRCAQFGTPTVLASTTVVAPATTTTTTLAADATSIPSSGSTKLTATVTSVNPPSPDRATPVGTVQFSDVTDSSKVVTLGSPVPVAADGTASADETLTGVGVHKIEAAFTPTDTADFTGSTSAPITVTVTQPHQTSVSLALTDAAGDPIGTGSAGVTAGQPITATATITSPDGTPSAGTVQFQFVKPTKLLGSPVAVGADGVATATLHLYGLSGFDYRHNLAVSYSGGGGFAGASSPPVQVDVFGTDTTTSMYVSPSTVAANSPTSLQASVSTSDDGLVIGEVQFSDVTDPANPVDLGDPVALSDGTASLAWTFATLGDHTVQAHYLANPGSTRLAGFGGSTSSAATVHVRTSSTTSLSVSPSTVAAGSATSLQATVSTSGGAPVTGAVQFSDVTDPANPVNLGDPMALTDGAASLSWSFATPGDHTIQAHYLGEAGTDTAPDGFVPSTSTPVTVHVRAAPVTVTVSAASSPVDVWALDAFTATVTGDSTDVPTGSVQFWNGQRYLATVALDDTGTASWPVGWFEGPGSQPLTAVYLPDSGSAYAGGSASTSVTVNPAPTSPPAWSATGALTLTAQQKQGEPTKSSPLPPGALVVDNSYDPSTGALTGKLWSPVEVIHGAGTRATYDIALRFVQDGDATGTVSPDGTVRLNLQLNVQMRTIDVSSSYVNGLVAMPSCTFGPIDVHLTGTASSSGLRLSDTDFSIKGLPDGADCGSIYVQALSEQLQLAPIITRNVVGDGNQISLDIAGDFTPPTQTVISGVSVTGPQGGDLVAGGTVQASAMVSTSVGPEAGTVPSGSVDFVDVTNPADPVTLGSGSIGEDGLVSTSFVMPASGTRQVVAKFAGVAPFSPATSDPVSVDVGEDPVTISLSAEPTSVGVYDAVTLTASLSSAPLDPTGTVNFVDVTDPDNPVTLNVSPGANPTVVPVSVAADGTATLNPAWFTTPGDHKVEAVYSGDAAHGTVTSKKLTVSVAPAPTGWSASGVLSLPGLGLDLALPDGTRYVDNSYNPLTGEFTGRLWTSPVSALGLAQMRIEQASPVTGTVKPDGTVSLTSTMAVQVYTLLGAPAEDCTFSPVVLHFTGTVSETGKDEGIHLTAPKVTLPPVAADACNGNGALISGVLGANPAKVTLDIGGSFPLPPTSGATVTELYHAILGRSPDAGGLNYWANQLVAGTATPAQVAAALASSSEASRVIVTDLYQVALGRTPDSGGLAFWSGWLTDGGRPDVLLARLQASNEAYTNAGANNIGWVKALYQQLLGRDADVGGLNYWVAQLATGMSRQQVALRLGATSEAVRHAVDTIVGPVSVCDEPAQPASSFSRLLDAYRSSHHNPALVAGLGLAKINLVLDCPLQPPTNPAT